MKRVYIITIFFIALFFPTYSLAVETAPRISDREIIESLATLKEGQMSLSKRIDDMNQRFDDMNRRFDDINRRFDDITWILGLFISITLIILGFVLRMQWQMNKRQAQMETTLETHKDEIAFLKDLIQKLLPPKHVL